MKNIHEYVYADEVLDFVRKAKGFVDLLGENQIDERADFLEELLTIMPALYSAFLTIPANEPLFEGSNEKFVTEEDWSKVFQNISGILGSQNEYIDVPEEDEYDRLELISRSLAEDITDVYQDIKDFLSLFRNGNEEVMNDALWECRQNFQNYWGSRLLRASYHLHKILVTDNDILDQKDREWEEKHSTREYNTDEWIISKRQKDAGEHE
jgi:hypothetical protein